jgi:hypothetical protein
MKDKTDELHERYYRKFGRLNACSELLGVQMKQAIEANLLAEYKAEYQLMHKADDIELSRANYALDYKAAELKPRNRLYWLFWRKPNRAAEEMNDMLQIEVDEFFASQKGKPNDEPLPGQVTIEEIEPSDAEPDGNAD